MPALSAKAATEAFLFHGTVALRLDDKGKAGHLKELLISPTPPPYNLPHYECQPVHSLGEFCGRTEGPKGLALGI